MYKINFSANREIHDRMSISCTRASSAIYKHIYAHVHHHVHVHCAHTQTQKHKNEQQQKKNIRREKWREKKKQAISSTKCNDCNDTLKYEQQLCISEERKLHSKTLLSI